MAEFLGTRRYVEPEIRTGESVTRFHLVSELSDLMNSEIHVSHYPDGDVSAPAQWYGLYENPTPFILELIQRIFNIDTLDWRITTTLLGNFKWVMFKHASPPARNEIIVDEDAMRQNEWSTTYF